MTRHRPSQPSPSEPGAGRNRRMTPRRTPQDNVRAAADKIIAGTKDGTYEVFTGPISDQTGKERVAKGQRMEDKDLLVMDWYVKGVQS